MEVFLVGGALRDELLAQPVTDHDWVVVGATDQEMRAAGYRSVGKSFPVYLHPETGEEYALARQEKKFAAGHQGFEFETDNVSLEQDLLRRDLTINAIARDLEGQWIDPMGGRNDIEEKLLRHISPAFSEDPLRVLRVARFAARFHHLGFRIADETLSLMAAITSGGELQTLSSERVVEETRKALSTQDPIIFFEVLSSCGAHAILWPEIDLSAIPNSVRARITEDPGLQWAAMLHTQSADVISTLDRRLPLPSAWVQQAVDTMTLNTLWSDFDTLSSTGILEMLYQLDSFRQGERLQTASALLVLINDSDDRSKRVHQNWIEVLGWTRSISGAQVMATQPTLEGAAIGSAIREARLSELGTQLGR